MIYWITGKAGAGKTTLAKQLAEKLGAVLIDGDELRATVSKDLGFSKADREENARRALGLAQAVEGDVVVAMMQPPPIPTIVWLTGEGRHKQEWEGFDSYVEPTVYHYKDATLDDLCG